MSFPGMWGVLAFVGNFIPYVGSVIALVLPVLLALLELEPPWRPLAVLALLLLAHFVTNNFIEPRLTAHAVDLNPLVVLVALAFWGLCWGVVGMVLAVPLTVMVKIVLRERRTHTSPGSADGRGVKKERPRHQRSHGDQGNTAIGSPTNEAEFRAPYHLLDDRVDDVLTRCGGSNRPDETALLVWKSLGTGGVPAPTWTDVLSPASQDDNRP